MGIDEAYANEEQAIIDDETLTKEEREEISRLLSQEN